jgi:hypothetical protein
VTLVLKYAVEQRVKSDMRVMNGAR